MAIVMRLDRMMAYRKMPLGKLAERVGIADSNLSELDCGVGDLIEYVEDEEEADPGA